METYDVIVIGTGAGNIVSDAALEAGKKVAIIEKHLFGGTCLNRGCIPTKVMITAANLIRDMQKAEKIGIEADHIRMNWKTVKDRVFYKISENSSIYDAYTEDENCTVYRGIASLIREKVIQVKMNDGSETKLLTADQIFIATGTKTKIDEVPGLTEAGYVTSESFFSDAYPDEPYRDVVILGGGAIATEFAHIFRAAGASVKLIQRNIRLLPNEDKDLSSALKRQLEASGIDVHLHSIVQEVSEADGKKVLRILNRNTNDVSEIKSDTIFLATGVEAHGLLHPEAGNIQVDNKGLIVCNEFLETSSPGVYALGDCKGGPQLRHRANYEAEILAHNLFLERGSDWEPRWARYDLIPFVTYTYPEVAHVGMTEETARRNGFRLKVGIHHYSQTAKGYSLGYDPDAVDDGFVKMVVDRDSKTILGVHIIGPEASVLIQPYVFLLNAGRIGHCALNPSIESEQVAEYRKRFKETVINPASVRLQDEAMVPHPALSEVAAWTTAFLEDVD